MACKERGGGRSCSSSTFSPLPCLFGRILSSGKVVADGLDISHAGFEESDQVSPTYPAYIQVPLCKHTASRRITDPPLRTPSHQPSASTSTKIRGTREASRQSTPNAALDPPIPRPSVTGTGALEKARREGPCPPVSPCGGPSSPGPRHCSSTRTRSSVDRDGGRSSP